MSTTCLHPLEAATLSLHKICPDFVGPRARRELWADIQQLPPTLDWVAYERRLESNATGVDLSVSISRDLASRFAAALDTDSPHADVVKRWARDCGSMALRRVPNIWLEFDHKAKIHRPLWERAFCFLAFDAGPHPRGPDSLLPQLMHELCEGAAPERALALSVELEQQLSTAARMLNVAYLSHRGAPEIRLHFAISRTHLQETMGNLGWVGDKRSLLELTTLFASVDLDRVAVQIGIGEGLLPTAGFELYLGEENAHERWPVVFDRMTELGLMSSDEAGLLQLWHGRSTLGSNELSGFGFPAHLDLVRRTHVKFMIDDTGFTGAKAYLFAHPRFVPF